MTVVYAWILLSCLSSHIYMYIKILEKQIFYGDDLSWLQSKQHDEVETSEESVRSQFLKFVFVTLGSLV